MAKKANTVRKKVTKKVNKKLNKKVSPKNPRKIAGNSGSGNSGSGNSGSGNSGSGNSGSGNSGSGGGARSRKKTSKKTGNNSGNKFGNRSGARPGNRAGHTNRKKSGKKSTHRRNSPGKSPRAMRNAEMDHELEVNREPVFAPEAPVVPEEKLFRTIRAKFVGGHPGVAPGKMMSSEGITYRSKVFAFYYNQEMVFRLGKDYNAKEEGLTDWEHLSPFKDKPPMTGWYCVAYSQKNRWEELALAALETLRAELS